MPTETIETLQDAELALLGNGENLRVPCSRYGWDTRSCIPVAYAAGVILSRESGETLTPETLDYVMGLVVNDHDDIAYLIREYGEGYGFSPEDYLEVTT